MLKRLPCGLECLSLIQLRCSENLDVEAYAQLVAFSIVTPGHHSFHYSLSSFLTLCKLHIACTHVLFLCRFAVVMASYIILDCSKLGGCSDLWHMVLARCAVEIMDVKKHMVYSFF